MSRAVERINELSARGEEASHIHGLTHVGGPAGMRVFMQHAGFTSLCVRGQYLQAGGPRQHLLQKGAFSGHVTGLPPPSGSLIDFKSGPLFKYSTPSWQGPLERPWLLFYVTAPRPEGEINDSVHLFF